MARSIDLFIDCDRRVEDLATEIGRSAGVELTPADGRRRAWTLEQAGLHAELAAHPYADDGDLRLSRYKYALSARVPSGTRLPDAPETAFLRMVADSLHKVGIATLLVHDLQYRDTPGEADFGQPWDGGAKGERDQAAGDGRADEGADVEGRVGGGPAADGHLGEATGIAGSPAGG